LPFFTPTPTLFHQGGGRLEKFQIIIRRGTEEAVTGSTRNRLGG
jgi:hypothetical protein